MPHQKEGRSGFPSNHPSQLAKRMVVESAGKLPTFLVMIFLVALAAAFVAGFSLWFFHAPKKSYEHLPLRLEAHVDSPKISSRNLQGVWTAREGAYAMTLRFREGFFEWVVEKDGEDKLRYFARGNYRLEGDVMILGQRADMGVPYDPKNRFASYLPLSLHNVNLYVKLNETGLSWHLPGGERARLALRVLRFFPSSAAEPIVWKKARR